MLIVTPNPCIDRTHRVDHFAPGTVNRPRAVELTAGGKGVNVARTLQDLGRPALLLGFRPDEGGGQLERLLAAEGIEADLVAVPGAVRQAIAVLEDSGRATVLNEPGPQLTDADADALLAVLAARVGGATVVVASGSLPPGLSADTYARLCRLARAGGAAVVVDAARAALAGALAAEPDLVTPNLAEAEGLVTGAVAEPADPEPGDAPPVGSGAAADAAAVRERAHLAARSLRAAGARRAVVTAGRSGAAYADDRGERWWPAPAVERVNPVGAGDALVGGVADGLLAGADWPAAVRHGVLVASASVEHPRAGRVDPDRVARLAEQAAREADGGGRVA